MACNSRNFVVESVSAFASLLNSVPCCLKQSLPAVHHVSKQTVVAASGKVKQTGAEGERMKEGAMINKSLFLGKAKMRAEHVHLERSCFWLPMLYGALIAAIDLAPFLAPATIYAHNHNSRAARISLSLSLSLSFCVLHIPYDLCAIRYTSISLQLRYSTDFRDA